VLRQKGHETGQAFCSAKGVAWMNQSFVPPVPFSRDSMQWADVNHFDGGRIAATKLTYNAATQRYEWTETGPLAGDAEQPLSEASLARTGDRWVVAARTSGKLRGAAWAMTDDPFQRLGPRAVGKEPATDSPLTVFNCPEGVLRIFTGDFNASPRRRGRDPLYCWDVSAGTEGVSVSNRREVFDSVKQGLKFRHETWPRVDFAILFPPHGNKQVLAYRVSPRSYNFPYDGRPEIPAIDAKEKALCGFYYSVLTYEGELAAAPWKFE
jgi:hypothetical protein